MGNFKIVTYNLRCVYSDEQDGVNCFWNRVGSILHRIEQEQPDVIAFQEATEISVDFLKPHLPAYDLLFDQRGANYDGEGLAIAVRRVSFYLLTNDFFWLSPTPDIPGSRYEGQSSCPRICQCALLKRRVDGQMVRVYNVHLDHVSDDARVRGIRPVIARMAADREKADYPVFLLGDFNALPASEPIAFCRENAAFPLTELTEEVTVTFHNYGRNADKIDYIFADAATAALPRTVTRWDGDRAGVWLSDHYPVAVSLNL